MVRRGTVYHLTYVCEVPPAVVIYENKSGLIVVPLVATILITSLLPSSATRNSYSDTNVPRFPPTPFLNF